MYFNLNLQYLCCPSIHTYISLTHSPCLLRGLLSLMQLWLWSNKTRTQLGVYKFFGLSLSISQPIIDHNLQHTNNTHEYSQTIYHHWNINIWEANMHNNTGYWVPGRQCDTTYKLTLISLKLKPRSTVIDIRHM